MPFSRRLRVAASCLGVFGQAALAQQPTIPIRSLGATIATSTDSIAGGSTFRILSDGRVLVNDFSKRRLLLLDANVQHAVVVADTTTGTAKAYGAGLSGMVPYPGDSTLVLDQLTGAFLIIDPLGKVARIIPKPGPARLLSPGIIGTPLGTDRAGHVFFRASPPVFLSLLDPDFVGDTLMVGPDSVAIMRQDLTTRRLDTLAMLQAPRLRQAVTRRGNGLGGSGRPALNPLPAGDDWTVLNDGSVAVVRVSDFHVDWIQPDRRATHGPKIPTQWVRLTDSMKVAIMDSVRGLDAAMSSGRGGGAMPNGQQRAYVQASDLPNYLPPFMMGSARADVDGNVWVAASSTTSAKAGVVVYDVISRDGGLIDRVQVPLGSGLVGFGPGVAYLTSFVHGMVQLAKVRLR